MANGPRKELSFLDRALMNKAATQGGVLNFLGKQPEVTAPVRAQSHADAPPTQLTYITDAEKDLLVKANIHGSLAGKPNPGPAGLESLDDFYMVPDSSKPGGYSIGGGGGSQVGSQGSGGSQTSSGGYQSIEDYTAPDNSNQYTGPQIGAGDAVTANTGINFIAGGNIIPGEKPPEDVDQKLLDEVKDTKKETKVKSFTDWFNKNVFGKPIEEINPYERDKILNKLKEFKELDVGIFQNFILNRGNAIAGLFGKDQTYTDMDGNVVSIDEDSIQEGSQGMFGVDKDGKMVEIRYSKEGFNDLIEDTFGKGIFQSLEKYEPQAYYPYAGMPQTSGGLVNLADNVAIDTSNIDRNTPEGKAQYAEAMKYNNMIFAAREQLGNMGKNPFTGNTNEPQPQGFAGIPGIPSLPVPRPGPKPPDSYPLPGQPPFMPGPGLPPGVIPPYGSKFEKTPYNYYAQSPQYRFRGVPSLNTNEFNEQLRRLYGVG